MLRRPKQGFVVIVLVLSVGFDSHAFAAGRTIEGVGTLVCKDVTDKIPYGQGWGADSYTTFVMSWIEGFASGVNTGANADKIEDQTIYFDLNTISLDEQWAYVLDVCRRNPNLDLSQAVVDMLTTRMPLKKATPSKPPPTPVPR
jgi:hypothetical protein